MAASAVEAALDAVFGADAADEVDDEAMLMVGEAQPVEKPMVYTATPALMVDEAQPVEKPLVYTATPARLPPQPPLEQAPPKLPQAPQSQLPPPPPQQQPPQAAQTAAGVMSTTSTTTTTMEVDDETVLLMCSGE